MGAFRRRPWPRGAATRKSPRRALCVGHGRGGICVSSGLRGHAASARALMPDPLPPICILAGGLGVRLGIHVRETPKPLLEVAGEPFLMHQLRLLARHGARETVICVGYLGEQIERRIGYRQFGLKIAYSYDGPELIGTLGAVRRALPALGGRFLVLYGDTYLPVDYRAATASWKEAGLPAMM